MLDINMTKKQREVIYKNSPYFRHYLSFGPDLFESKSKYAKQLEIENMILSYKSYEEITEKVYAYFKMSFAKKMFKKFDNLVTPSIGKSMTKEAKFKEAIELYIEHPNLLPFQNNEHLINDKSYDEKIIHELELSPLDKKKNWRIPKEVSLYIDGVFKQKFNPIKPLHLKLNGGFHKLTFKGSKAEYFSVDLFINRDMICFTSFDVLYSNFMNFIV